MSAAKRTLSSSPSPAPEAKKHLTNEADTVASLGAGNRQDAIELKTLRSLWINEDFYNRSPSLFVSQMLGECHSIDTIFATGCVDGPASTVTSTIYTIRLSAQDAYISGAKTGAKSEAKRKILPRRSKTKMSPNHEVSFLSSTSVSDRSCIVVQ